LDGAFSQRGGALNAAANEAVSLIALIGVLAWAVIRPHGWPEAVAAVPAAVILIAVGAISAGQSQPAGSRRLLAQVFVVAAVTTAVLSLDATVVLLTPVVFATAARLEVPARPHVYACTHLANSASLLLPVSNLTNLLAFAASGLAFGHFAALMAVPWLAAIGVEYAVFGRFFASDLNAGDLNVRPRRDRGRAGRDGNTPLPVFAVIVVAHFDDDRITNADEAWQHCRSVDAGACLPVSADHFEQARIGQAACRIYVDDGASRVSAIHPHDRGPDPDGGSDPLFLAERSARIERHYDVRPESKLVAGHAGERAQG
jgi:hypothetical protein